jgi:hypothetical protein
MRFSKQDDIKNSTTLWEQYKNSTDDEEKKEIQAAIQSMIHTDSCNAHEACPGFCLAVRFDLPKELQKTLALQLIQT